MSDEVLEGWTLTDYDGTFSPVAHDSDKDVWLETDKEGLEIEVTGNEDARYIFVPVAVIARYLELVRMWRSRGTAETKRGRTPVRKDP